MLPIPMNILTSSAEVRTPVDGDGGYQEYTEPVVISNVRYEMVSGVRPTAYQLQDGTTGVLFIDAVNSTGSFEVPAGSLVRVDGAAAECCVAACRRYEGFSGYVHHWEVELR